MLVGPYLSHPLTRNMKNAHSSNSTPSAPSYSPPFDGIFIQTPLGAGRRPSPPRRAPSHATELAGGPESTQSLLELPACRHFYLNRVDLTRVATWRKLQRGAICRLKSKLNTSLGVGNRAVWKARGRGRRQHRMAGHIRVHFLMNCDPFPLWQTVPGSGTYWLQCAVVHGGNGLIYSLWQTWLRIGSRGAAMAPCKRSRPTCHILLFRDSSVVWSC